MLCVYSIQSFNSYETLVYIGVKFSFNESVGTRGWNIHLVSLLYLVKIEFKNERNILYGQIIYYQKRMHN